MCMAQQARDVTQLISTAQAAEREAGYVVLGALALALPPAQLAAQRAELLELWRVALAPDAAAELDVKKYLQVRNTAFQDSVRAWCWVHLRTHYARRLVLVSHTAHTSTHAAADIRV